MNIEGVTAEKALSMLKAGNEAYMTSSVPSGDISPEKRKETCLHGQSPYAVVVTCSDSRVMPEAIFSAGIGELFVIRTAGSVVGDHELGSIEYAAEHLGCRLAVVLGHTHCGAVGAALHDAPEGFVKTITGEIRLAVGDETDEYKACVLNVRHSVSAVKERLDAERLGLITVGAVYDIESGRVEFL